MIHYPKDDKVILFSVKLFAIAAKKQLFFALVPLIVLLKNTLGHVVILFKTQTRFLLPIQIRALSSFRNNREIRKSNTNRRDEMCKMANS